MWVAFLQFFLGNPLGRILSTVDTAINNETTREQVKADIAKSYMSAQVSLLTGRGWWFPLLFLIPAGLWFSAVCLYSVMFCHSCVFPQTWTIAALPRPLDEWMGYIVGSLFIGKVGEQIIARLK